MKRETTKVSFKEKCILLKKDFKINRALYLLLIPILIYYLVFCYGPMYGALIAFKDYTPRIGVMNSPWVGFRHFTNFFNSPSFMDILKNTLNISFSSLLL